MFNVKSMVSPIFSILKGSLLYVLKIVGVAALVFVSYVTFFFARYRITPKTTDSQLAALNIRHKPYSFFRWLLVDFKRADKKDSRDFKEYGFSIYVGRQGAGKTVSMVEYLARMRALYPDCIIVTNFKSSLSDYQMTDWRDFFEIRNGEKGVIFALDEIQSEYDSMSWKDFPESLLSEISQQRKQRVKIVGTSQVFKRLAKPIREQSFTVTECKTYFGRWTFCKVYDSFEYDSMDTTYVVRNSIKPLYKYNYIQSDDLRNCYDTYEKIARLGRSQFIPRHERTASDIR